MTNTNTNTNTNTATIALYYDAGQRAYVLNITSEGREVNLPIYNTDFVFVKDYKTRTRVNHGRNQIAAKAVIRGLGQAISKDVTLRKAFAPNDGWAISSAINRVINHDARRHSTFSYMFCTPAIKALSTPANAIRATLRAA